MCEIYIDGKKVAEQIIPNYVTWEEKYRSWMTTNDEKKAEAILVDIAGEEPKQIYCDIDYKPYRHNDEEGNPFPVCHLEFVDA